MAKKKSSVSSKVHHLNVQHNFSGSFVAVIGGIFIVFALVLFVANNGMNKSGLSDMGAGPTDEAFPTDDSSIPCMFPTGMDCEDTDSGLDYSNMGVVSRDSTCFQDACLSSNPDYLTEYTCNDVDTSSDSRIMDAQKDENNG